MKFHLERDTTRRLSQDQKILCAVQFSTIRRTLSLFAEKHLYICNWKMFRKFAKKYLYLSPVFRKNPEIKYPNDFIKQILQNINKATGPYKKKKNIYKFIALSFSFFEQLLLILFSQKLLIVWNFALKLSDILLTNFAWIYIYTRNKISR